jgi:hypothetical protein
MALLVPYVFSLWCAGTTPPVVLHVLRYSYKCNAFVNPRQSSRSGDVFDGHRETSLQPKRMISPTGHHCPRRLFPSAALGVAPTLKIPGLEESVPGLPAQGPNPDPNIAGRQGAIRSATFRSHCRGQNLWSSSPTISRRLVPIHFQKAPYEVVFRLTSRSHDPSLLLAQ